MFLTCSVEKAIEHAKLRLEFFDWEKQTVSMDRVALTRLLETCDSQQVVKTIRSLQDGIDEQNKRIEGLLNIVARNRGNLAALAKGKTRVESMLRRALRYLYAARKLGDRNTYWHAYADHLLKTPEGERAIHEFHSGGIIAGVSYANTQTPCKRAGEKYSDMIQSIDECLREWSRAPLDSNEETYAMAKLVEKIKAAQRAVLKDKAAM